MNVVTLLQERAREMPDRLAIIDFSGKTPTSLTFRELHTASQSVAMAFGGLAPGSRVAVVHPMNADLYVALAGLLRAGLVPTVCDPGAGRAPAVRCFELAAPKAIFASTAGFAYAATIPALRRCYHGAARHGSGEMVAREEADLALITFTSGSTGVPKVVGRTHGVLRAQLNAIRATLPLGGIDLMTMPIVALANLASGVTTVIPSVDVRRPGSIDAVRLAADIDRSAANSIVASPAMLERLIQIDVRKQVRTLRRIVSGGAPVMPPLMEDLYALAPQAEIVAMYGSTEAEPIAHLAFSSISSADMQAMRNGGGVLVGRPAADTDVTIDASDRDDIGEVLVSGAHVVPGYLDGVGDAEAKVRRAGRVWHRTGDLGRFDGEGRLWLVGRIGTAIQDARGAVYPLAVECALSFEPAVARSALANVDGKRVVALELQERFEADIPSIRQQLCWACVDEVRVVTRIPVDRRHNAKTDYPALNRLLGSCA